MPLATQARRQTPRQQCLGQVPHLRRKGRKHIRAPLQRLAAMQWPMWPCQRPAWRPEPALGRRWLCHCLVLVPRRPRAWLEPSRCQRWCGHSWGPPKPLVPLEPQHQRRRRRRRRPRPRRQRQGSSCSFGRRFRRPSRPRMQASSLRLMPEIAQPAGNDLLGRRVDLPDSGWAPHSLHGIRSQHRHK